MIRDFSYSLLYPRHVPHCEGVPFLLEFISNNGWVILHSLSDKCFWNLFPNSYEDWRDKFVQVGERDGASPVTTRVRVDHIFPLSYVWDPLITKGWNPLFSFP